MQTPPSLNQIQHWLTELGFDGEIPSTPSDALELLREEQRKHDPSKKQLNFLKSLGYNGRTPYTMYGASILIEYLLEKQNEKVPLSIEEMTDEPVTEKQDEILEVLGCNWRKHPIYPEDQAHASHCIDALINGANRDRINEYLIRERYGRCANWNGFEDEELPGTVRYTFSIADLNAIHKRIHAALPNINYTNGWSVLRVDWGSLFNTLKHIKMNEGYSLGSMLYSEGGDSNGYVFGMRSDKIQNFEISGHEAKEASLYSPPYPRRSVKRYMRLFTGDGSPESYMEAMILANELKEFGARWHGCDWSNVSLYGPDDVLALTDRREYQFLFGSAVEVSAKANPTVTIGPKKTVFRCLAHTTYCWHSLFLMRHFFNNKTMEFKVKKDDITWGFPGVIP